MLIPSLNILLSISFYQPNKPEVILKQDLIFTGELQILLLHSSVKEYISNNYNYHFRWYSDTLIIKIKMLIFIWKHLKLIKNVSKNSKRRYLNSLSCLLKYSISTPGKLHLHPYLKSTHYMTRTMNCKLQNLQSTSEVRHWSVGYKEGNLRPFQRQLCQQDPALGKLINHQPGHTDGGENLFLPLKGLPH